MCSKLTPYDRFIRSRDPSIRSDPPADQEFQKLVLGFYAAQGRSFPWRTTRDPYEILVSEVMLQQTQTDRVVPKYLRFLERFPSVESLSRATTSEVIAEWSGLGYYRRALNLQRAAHEVAERYEGKIPRTSELLRALPGIGPYTAAAVAVFAFGSSEPMIETNIRAVFIHSFFTGRENVADKELLPIIERTIDRSNPRRWFYSLMDAGAHLKKIIPKIHVRSAHHVKQSKFQGSLRQVRAAVLKHIVQVQSAPLSHLTEALPYTEVKVRAAVEALVKDGMIENLRGRYAVSEAKRRER